MKKGLIVCAGQGALAHTMAYTYWCTKAGLFGAKDKQKLLGTLEKKVAYICKKCKIVQFEY